MTTSRAAALAAALIAFAAQSSAAQGLSVTHVDSQAKLVAWMPVPEAVLRARAGNRAWGGTHELSIAASAGGPQAVAQRAWKNGQTLPFRVTYDGFGYLALEVGGTSLARDVGADFSGLAVRAAARRKGTSVRASELRLNHDAFAPSLVASSATGALDVDALVVHGAGLSAGFVLRGELRLAWTQAPPHFDEAVLDVWLGDLGALSQDYCTAAPNSTRASCDLAFSGWTSIASDDLRLHATGGVPGAALLFIGSDGAQSVPFGNGWLCVGPQIARLSDVAAFDGLGRASCEVPLDSGALADGPLAVAPGAMRTFQVWYRDPLAPPAYFNLSDALALTFVP